MQHGQASIQTGSCRRIYGTPSRPVDKPPEKSQRVQKTNVDILHVQHSLRATISQEDRECQHFKTPTVRGAKSNDNTNIARPPPRVRTGVREPPRQQTKKPRKGQCDRPESSATQQRIRRTADFQKLCLPSPSPYHELHDTGCDPEANGRTHHIYSATDSWPSQQESLYAGRCKASCSRFSGS